MKIFIQNLLAAMFLIAFSFQSHSQGVIDQESYPTPISPFINGVDGTVDGLYLTDEPAEQFLQSFVPSLSAIDFISLEFQSGTGDATVAVNLYEGSPFEYMATLIGTTESATMPAGFVNDGLFVAGVETFEFSNPITLTPGNTYYFEPVLVSGGADWNFKTLIDFNTYPNGELYVNGYPFVNNTEIWFQEGIDAVPEPTTLALIVLGGFLMFLLFKHRSKLVVLLLFASPVLPVYSADSVVQATASAAGLSSVSATELPENGGTYWITSINPNGGLTTLPYPFLPTDMSGLPIFWITNHILLVDDTKGEISSSSETISRADASSAVAAESQTVENLIEMVETPPAPPTNGETGGTDGTPQPNGLTPTSDTTNMWVQATNEAPDIGLQLMNADPNGNNYQLLSTTNLLNDATNWNLGQILTGVYDSYFSFNPIPFTNTMTFFRVHQANPIMEVYNNQNETEPVPTNNDPGQAGSFIIQNDSYNTTNDVIVYFTLSGTAQSGTDYSNIPNCVVVSNSIGYATVNIYPIADGLKPNQTVIISLTQNSNYLINPESDSTTNYLTAEPQVYPIADNGDIQSVCPDTTNEVPMQANDPRNLTLNYIILSWPTHGTLYTNGTQNCTYVPTNCYEGPDSFTFEVSDGQYTSTPATATLDVTPDYILASSIYAQTCRGTSVPITLSAQHSCTGNTISYYLLSNPSEGSVTGTPPNLVYTPTGTNYTGSDSFNYYAISECGSASTNTVTVTVGDDNISPQKQFIVTGTNQTLAITLNATSGDRCTEDTNDFVYAITSQPTYGTMGGSGANVTYTPNNDYEGPDSFQFTASDGYWTSSPATIYLYVVAGPILTTTTTCDPFETAVQLNWSLDTNVNFMWIDGEININDFIVYRSTNSVEYYTAIATNFNTFLTTTTWTNYTDNGVIGGQTYYYKVAFQSDETATNTSPFSNIIETSSQNPDNLISADSFWEVVTNLADTNVVTDMQAPLSSYYPNQYPGIYPLPNSHWDKGTTNLVTTTFVVPTNTDLSQIQYSIAIDNDYYLYLNNSYVDYVNHENEPAWSTFQPFPTGLLHDGTNTVHLEIIDEAPPNYFSMVVTTNTCSP
jgi:hypothetical protein